MPRTKWTLTNNELIVHAARAAQLRAMGVEISVPPLPSPPPTVEVEIGFDYNIIFNSSPLDVTLATSVRILPRRSGIYLADQVDVTVPFDTSTFELCYPTGRDNKYWVLRNRSFDYAEVLNHRLESGIRLVKGKAVSGLLLLYAQGQLPAEYRHGARINVNLTFFDSLGTEYDAQTAVRVHRQAESSCRSKVQTAHAEKKSNLYEEAPRPSIVQNVQSSSAEKPPALSAERRKELVKEMEKQALASWRRKLAGPLEALRQGTLPSFVEERDKQNLIYLASTAEPSQSDSIPGRAEPSSATNKTELPRSMSYESVRKLAQSSSINLLGEWARAAAETDAFFSALQKRSQQRGS